MNNPWFSLLINEEAQAVILDLFGQEDRGEAEIILNAILQNTAVAVLVQEIPKESLEYILPLLRSEQNDQLQKWLLEQPETIKTALRERLDRTLLELQSQLVGKL